MDLQGEKSEVASVTGDAAKDINGNEPDKSRTGGWVGAGLILVTELGERICIMGISMNLVTYLTGDLHLSTSKSANVVTNFMGTLYLLALLSGFLADAKLGRYVTIAVFSTITALGVSMLTLATTLSRMRPLQCTDEQRQHHQCTLASGGQLAVLYVSLYTIALGAGGVKANVSGFGSDQFDVNDPKEEKAMIFFFNWFYFFISLGSLFAVTVLVHIQDNVGRGWGYGISAAAMAAAVMVLLAGTPRYRYRRPQGSSLTVIWKVVYFAWKKRGVAYPEYASQLHGYHNSSEAVIANETGGRCSTMVEVEEVKMVLKLLPIWSTCILFWTVYSQMTTFSVEQATYMDRRISSSTSFAIPAGSFSFSLFATILLFTSLNEKLVVPLARKLTRNPQGITSLQRVAVGLIFSMLAMVVSAIVEKQRRELLAKKQIKISAFWLVPQYFFVGAGEAFAYVGQLEFFIREAPERMKSMSTGLFLATLSMGFFVSSLLVSLVDVATGGRWIKNNLNKGKLDYFYWLLAVLGILNFVIFLVFTRRHEYKVQHRKWVGKEIEELKVYGDDIGNEDGLKKDIV